MTIKFFDPPVIPGGNIRWPGVPPGATEVATKAGLVLALGAIPLPAAPLTFIPANRNDVTAAMRFDSNAGFNWAVCNALTQSFLTKGSGVPLVVKPRLSKLVRDKARISTELLSCAIVLAAARKCPQVSFIADVKDLRKLFPNDIQNLWTGLGPDYVICTGANDAWFLEVKGSRSMAGLLPVSEQKFLNNKTQSLNGCIGPGFAGAAGHILSYVQLVSSVPASVRCYNHRADGSRALENVRSIEPHVALCQFLGHLRSDGFIEPESIFFSKTFRENFVMSGRFELLNGWWIERSDDELHFFAIADKALRVFQSVWNFSHSDEWSHTSQMELLNNLYSLRRLKAPPGVQFVGQSVVGTAEGRFR